MNDEQEPAAKLNPDLPISITQDAVNRRTIISGTDIDGVKVKVIAAWRDDSDG